MASKTSNSQRRLFYELETKSFVADRFIEANRRLDDRTNRLRALAKGYQTSRTTSAGALTGG
ncbi:hypothetical protein [Lysinibacillus yapensis]|uniref:hypothetical protein n=1 Tax=Ureibacillus yapensis TaxID=2304605 RepID=UPI001F241409|nr:hypothetical protein [Lysinibacillus yapensis]